MTAHRSKHPRRLSILVASTLAVLSLGACSLRGNGNEAVDTRELDSFHAVDLGGAFELVVHVAPGDAQRVEVRGDENIVPKITTKVSDGELAIGLDHWMVRPDLPMKIEIWVPSLTAIDASGAADIEVEGLHGERFELDVSGASDTTLAGDIASLEVDSSGASKLDARSLHAKTVEIELSGAGEAQIWASESLDAEISGAGKIRYWGEPVLVSKDVSGAGSIEAAH